MDSQAICAACNVCGGTKFGYGPSQRLSVNNRLPHCETCHSLERHRIARRVFDRLRPHLDGKRFLQFSPDPSVDPRWFAELMVSVWEGENSLDMQAIAVPDGRFDWIYSSHVLNHVPDQAAALRDMLRVVGNQGVVVLSVGGTVFNYATRPSDRTFGKDYQFVLYGTEFADEVQTVLPDVAVLELVAADPCTASIDSLYLYSRAQRTLSDMASRVVGDNVHARVFPPRPPAAKSTAAATMATSPSTPLTEDEAPFSPCNICGATQFGPGPSNRRSSPQNRLPQCRRCLSLERHRVMRRVFDVLVPTRTRGTRLLQFETDPGLCEEWFEELRISSERGDDRVNLEAIAEGRYDWVCSSHLLSDAREDRAQLKEMLRVVGSRGVVALSLRGTAGKYETVTSLSRESDLDRARAYGSEFIEDVTRLLPEAALLELVTADPCTGSVDAVYLCALDPEPLKAVASTAAASDIYPRFFAPTKASPAAVAVNEADWERLGAEIEAWRAAGHRPRFWVRDDDASTYSDELAQLAKLCSEEQVPLALAVIPQRAGRDLAEAVKGRSEITVLQHGFDHHNRSSTQPSSEFPDERPLNESLDSVRLGWTTLASSFGDQAIPVFVPPWGTCSVAVRQSLAGLGLTGFSGSQIGAFSPAELWRRGSAHSSDGLKLASAHISVNRSKLGDTSALPASRHVTFLADLVHAIRTEGDDHDEPIGIMTHAWGVDGAVRDFLRHLFRVTRASGAEWVSARQLFGG